MVFKEFFNGIVKHIFKNAALLNSLKDFVKELIANFDDVEIMHSIAENFASKKDYVASEEIYRRILQIEPQNEKASRKLHHFIAMRDPSAVRYEDLPPIQLITENEKLRAIEVDFQQYKNNQLTRAASTL